jgi:hypothetical protein
MTWAGCEVETLFICLLDRSAGDAGGIKKVLIVVDRRRSKRAQFSVCRISVGG